jgi:hypothetical protein
VCGADPRAQGEATAAVSTEEQRAVVSAALDAADSWLWDEGADATLEMYEAKRREMLAALAPIRLRVAEQERRPVALAAAQLHLADLANRSSVWPTTKPHVRVRVCGASAC